MHEERLLIAAEADFTLSFRHPTLGEPTQVWPYHNENGQLIGWVCRFDPPGRKKEVLPYTLWSTARCPDGEWLWRSWPEPRPLYGLDLLAIFPQSAIVIVCEGEKATNAARILCGYLNFVCITSPGGSNAARKADWSPVRGRKVIIWPDNDEPGWKYAGTVAEILGEHNEVLIIPPPIDKATGWDAADALAEGWPYEQA